MSDADEKRRRIRALMDERDLKPADWARRAKVSKNLLYNFLNGHSDSLSYKTLEKLALALGMDVDTLWRGPASEPKQPVPRKTSPTQAAESDMIPIYGPAAAGTAGYVLLTDDNIIDMDHRPPSLRNVKGGFGMYVAGQSMEPRHFHGERVWVNPWAPPAIGQDCIIVMEPDGNALIKCFMGANETEYKFRQWNPQETFTVPRDMVRKLYAVTR